MLCARGNLLRDGVLSRGFVYKWAMRKTNVSARTNLMRNRLLRAGRHMLRNNLLPRELRMYERNLYVWRVSPGTDIVRGWMLPKRFSPLLQ